MTKTQIRKIEKISFDEKFEWAKDDITKIYVNQYQIGLKINEIIEVLNARTEREEKPEVCGMWKIKVHDNGYGSSQRFSEGERTKCQNPRGQCPVHDKKEHLNECPQNEIFGTEDSSCTCKPQPSEGWAERFDNKFIQQKDATFCDKEGFYQHTENFKSFIQSEITQAKEEEREKMKLIINDKLKSEVYKYFVDYEVYKNILDDILSELDK